MAVAQPHKNRHPLQGLAVATTVTLALLAAGCNSSSHTAEGEVTGSLSDGSAGSDQLQRASEFWSNKFTQDPSDKSAAIKLSQLLRAQDKKTQAVIVMRQAEVHHSDDRDVLAELGKALADAGSPQDAEKALAKAIKAGPPDWQLLSAHGAVLDQLRQHKKAREAYARALEIVRNEPSVLNNLGLSYALDGDLPKAETTLRTAARQSQAGREVAENLALILGLQGKFDEAEQVARAALPAATVSNNMSYLKQLLSQPTSWAKLQALEAKNKPAKAQ